MGEDKEEEEENDVRGASEALGSFLSGSQTPWSPNVSVQSLISSQVAFPNILPAHV